MKYFFLLSITALLLAQSSCKKWEDKPAVQDPRITERKYCNDPDAINYNWNFPGTPDNSVCIFPSDNFSGTYLYTDSIYSADNVLDTLSSPTTYLLRVFTSGKRNIRVTGFCSPADSLLMTAERSTFRANVDTTLFMNDTTKVFGQLFCRPADTLSGYFYKPLADTAALHVNFKVVSDTGVNYHRGTAVKQ